MLIGACTAIGGCVALLNMWYLISHPYIGAALQVTHHKSWAEVVPICMAPSKRWAQTTFQSPVAPSQHVNGGGGTTMWHGCLK